MLHNTTRETLLQSGRGSTALVIDALYLCGLKPYTQFTYSQAHEQLAWMQINPKLVRRGLADPLFSPKGRRNVIYTLPAASTARKHVNASYNGISDDLPAEAFRSLHEYRKALHHALICRRPGIYTRGLLARRLGVCKKTTANYDKQLGHHVEPTITSQGAAELHLRHMSSANPQKRKLFLALLDAEGWVDRYLPYVRAVALHWLQAGRKVEVWEQHGNRYAPISPALYYAQNELYHT